MLAEIYNEGNDIKRAASLYKPLIDDIVQDSSRSFDEITLRVFNGAGQAFLLVGDVANVTTVGAKLAEIGPDQPRVNDTIINFAMRLERERKKAMAEGDSGDPTAPGGGESKLKALTELQEKIVGNLSKREKLSYPAMVWTVKTASNLDTDAADAAAAELIEKIFDKANNDQEFEKEIGKAEAGLHALGASLQAKRHEYSKAKDQIDAVILKYPHALDPRISEAKILTEWAAKDSSKYSDAIAKWDTLRKKLERISGSADPKIKDAKRIDPKYEVILNEADCFYRMAQKTKNKDNAKTGLDLLGPYLNLDEKIRNPSDEYKEISVKFFQVGGKLADFLGAPRPVRPKVKRTTSS